MPTTPKVSLGQKRYLSVVFVDLVGSTPMAERLGDERYGELNLRFREVCRAEVERNDGYIHQFAGDGMVAYFGYPTAHEDDARRAISTALAIMDHLQRIAPEVGAHWGEEMQARAAVHSGPAVLSDRSDSGRSEDRVALGATLNTAARLESEAEPGTVVVSATTRDLSEDFFTVKDLGTRRLKGVKGDVAVFEVIAATDSSGLLDVRRQSRTGFVGRDAELDTLLALWDRVTGDGPGTSRGAAVLIAGEPGIGKSRLVRELLGRTRPQGGAPVQLQCSAFSQVSDLSPVRSAVERYAGLIGIDKAQRAPTLEAFAETAGIDPATRIPPLALLFGIDMGDGYSRLELGPTQLNELILDTLVDMVTALGRRAPYICVVEDLHWSDASTLELIRRVAHSDAAVFLVMTTRDPHVLDTTPGDGQTIAPDFTTVPLSGFEPDETVEMLSTLLPRHLADGSVDHLVERSDGVPLYIEQLARTVADDPTGGDRIPSRLEELLQVRLESAGPAKGTAHLAAVCGRSFGLDLLERVDAVLANSADDRLASSSVQGDVQALVDVGLVERSSDEREMLQFRHSLLARKAYESQLGADLLVRHASVGRALLDLRDETGTGEAATIALHFDRGGQPTEAVRQLLEAKIQAMERGALREAESNLARAAELIDDVSDDRLVLELGVRLERGFIASSLRGYGEAQVAEDYGRALEICKQLEDDRSVGTEVVKALFGTWTYHAGVGDLDNSELAENMLDRQLRAVSYAGGRPALTASEGVRMFYLGRYREARDRLEEAVVGLKEDPVDPWSWHLPNDPLVAAGSFLMLVRFLGGDEAGALQLSQEMKAYASGLDFPQRPFSEAFLKNLEGWILRYMGDTEAALTSAEEMLHLGEKHGFRDFERLGAINVLLCQGFDAPSAELCADLADRISRWRAEGDVVLIHTLMVQLGALYLMIGEIDAAAAEVDAAIEHAMSSRQRGGITEAYVARAWIETTAGADPGVVEDTIATAIQIAIDQQAPFNVIRCGVTAADLLPEPVRDAHAPVIRQALAAFDAASTIPDVVRAREIYA